MSRPARFPVALRSPVSETLTDRMTYSHLVTYCQWRRPNADTRGRLEEILSAPDHDPRRLDGGAIYTYELSEEDVRGRRFAPGTAMASRTARKPWC